MKSTRYKIGIISVSVAKNYIETMQKAGFKGKTFEHYKNSSNKIFTAIERDRGALYFDTHKKTYSISAFNKQSYERFNGQQIDITSLRNLMKEFTPKTSLYEIY